MDIPAMRASFAKAAAHGDQVPLWFYSHLFLTHPETREMFPVSMATQRDRLFAALGEVMSRVDDLDALVPILQQLGRDHRKFGALAAHYPAVGASLLATLEHFDEEWDDELAASWTEAYGLIADVMIGAADEAADQPAWWEAEVVAHERRTLDVAVLQVRPRTPLEHLPGQAVSLEIDQRPRLWRWYSPANAPRPDGVLELHVKARDGGPVSSALVRLTQVGDVMRLGPPVGHLTLDTESDRDLLLVAGGTGLAPLKALVDQVARHGPARRVDLFVGARTEDAFYDRADLRRLEQEHPWLTVTPAVSQEKGSPAEHGDIGDVVLRHGPWNSRDVYVAGNPAMIEDTVTRLIHSGVPMARIRTEVFAPSRPSPTLDGKVTE
ncbi:MULTISPECIES: globin domain-containing protein [unclassified Modestobacter]|uniref:globin domain-containing protein n=1 Tax=unclassified Modestobacter TaxID=2643866 RepID=UPI0022AA556C|nr:MULTISPECIES: globin domain-containing protein [unclassified Modestobacter]MCZ2826291.1 FAD-binding oxidoreductase [Modestobacter sp. VKM Ac-2981]MCZ2852644.1 FAD-binding oxidoreductase [Modestobacter sp. VKM Ac-2982]